MSGIRLNIALVKYRREDYTGAIPPLESVLRDQPNSTQARYLLGAVPALHRAIRRCCRHTRAALADFVGRHHVSLRAWASPLIALGQKEFDEKAMSRLIEIGSDTPEFHLILGKAYLNRGESEQAVAAIAKGRSRESGFAVCPFRPRNRLHEKRRQRARRVRVEKRNRA